MNIVIHRGAHQIGGCVTEISTGSCRIIIDLGSNLPGGTTREFTPVEVKKMTAGVDAVFYTHYHGDHVGLFHLVPSSVHQFIGKGAKEVMLCKYKALRDDAKVKKSEELSTYDVGRRIDVADKGEICVTPYLVCHSAFDAYMFKIECEGRVILHTGDFRRHGYLGKGLIPTLKYYVGQVDVLITEGTMLGRQQETMITENKIRLNAIKFLRKHKYTFALCSSTDMERLASLHAACQSVGRELWVDGYQKRIFQILRYWAGKHASLFNCNRLFELTKYDAPKVRQHMQEVGFLMLIRPSQLELVKSMLRVYTDDPAWLIYSLWSGYAVKHRSYTNDSIIELRDLFVDRIMDGTKDGFHTSGHADVRTLREVCETVHPRLGIIPIHKESDTHLETLPGMEKFNIFTEGVVEIENIKISIQ